MSNEKATQQVTKEEIEKMKKTIAEEIILEDEDFSQSREIVTCKNIEIGEKKYNEFKGVVRLNGNFVQKVGRPLSYEEMEKNMPNMFDAIDNIEGAPKIVIETEKEFTAGLTLQTNEETAMRRLEATIKKIEKDSGKEVAELIRQETLNTRKILKEEIEKVSELGVKWNEGIVWDIWMIKRAIKQRAYMERESLPVDYLIELYSYIPKNEYYKIKEYYQSSFE